MITLEDFMLAGPALAISMGLSPCAHAQVGLAALPADITEFISRRTDCSEWSKKAIDEWSKKAIDREGAAEIEAIDGNLRSLKCFDIIDSERALRQKYAGNPEILTSLGAGNYTKFVTRLPLRIAVPPVSDR